MVVMADVAVEDFDNDEVFRRLCLGINDGVWDCPTSTCPINKTSDTTTAKTFRLMFLNPFFILMILFGSFNVSIVGSHDGLDDEDGAVLTADTMVLLP